MRPTYRSHSTTPPPSSSRCRPLQVWRRYLNCVARREHLACRVFERDLPVSGLEQVCAGCSEADSKAQSPGEAAELFPKLGIAGVWMFLLHPRCVKRRIQICDAGRARPDRDVPAPCEKQREIIVAGSGPPVRKVQCWGQFLCDGRRAEQGGSDGRQQSVNRWKQ